MKKFLTAVALLLSAWGGETLLAQDIVTLRNGEDLKAKILEVLPNEIKYKRYDNLDGPTFTLQKSEILMITYQNGTREMMVTSPTAASNARTTGMATASSDKVYAIAPENLRAGMKYKQLKKIYNKSAWDGAQYGDTYASATWCWNFLLPGLGQMVMGEGGRGAAFLGAELGCAVISGVGAGISANAIYEGDEGAEIAGAIVSIVGSLGSLGVYVWSLLDAANVMKIKNMYGRDMRGIASNVEFHISPWVSPARNINGNQQAAAGLALTMNF